MQIEQIRIEQMHKQFKICCIGEKLIFLSARMRKKKQPPRLI